MTMVTEMQQTLDEKIALILAKHDPMNIAFNERDDVAYDLEASDINQQWYKYDNKTDLIQGILEFWFGNKIDDVIIQQIVEDIKPLFA